MGGAFNPIHVGHLLIAESALDQFGLDQVVWVPTYRPPHKHQSLLAFAHRWEMVKRAIADHPQFVASDIEQQRQTISYASETLIELNANFPKTCWYWIIGLDAFQTLLSWRNISELAPQCIWLVAPRNQASTEKTCFQVENEFRMQSIQLRWHIIQMPQIDISSSLIRHYCQCGRSLRYLVSESVHAYIQTNNLYQRG